MKTTGQVSQKLATDDVLWRLAKGRIDTALLDAAQRGRVTAGLSANAAGSFERFKALSPENKLRLAALSGGADETSLALLLTVVGTTLGEQSKAMGIRVVAENAPDLKRQFLTLLDKLPQTDALAVVSEVARSTRPTPQPKPRHGAARPSLDDLTDEHKQQLVTEFWGATDL